MIWARSSIRVQVSIDVVCGVWCVVRGVWCELVLCVLRLDEQVNDKGEVKLCDFGLARLKNTAFVETVSNTAGLSLSCLFRVACVSFLCVASVLQPLPRLSATLPVSFASFSCLLLVFFVCCSLLCCSRVAAFCVAAVLQPLSRPSATLPVCLCRVACVSFSCVAVCCSLISRDRQQYSAFRGR